MTSTMSTLGLRTAILVAVAAAAGVIAALGRPWYGPAPAASEAASGMLPDPMLEFGEGVQRAFTEPEGVTGWQALGTADSVLAALAAVTAVLLALCLVPALRPTLQVLARWTALATLGLVVYCLVDEPGPYQLAEPRFGILVALGAAGVLAASAAGVSSAPRRHPAGGLADRAGSPRSARTAPP